MILGIGDIEIALGIERYTPRIAKAARFDSRSADNFQRLIIGIKDLDAAVAEFAHILPSGTVDTNIVRITQLALARSSFAVGADELAVAGKDLDAMIAGIGNIHVVL